VLFLFQSDVGMIEFVGLIKVNIVKGTDLAVRDVMSSDPYVMINLGHQVSTIFLA
jgi:stromal membrane-associated protein